MVINIDAKWIRKVLIVILALAILFGAAAYTVGSAGKTGDVTPVPTKTAYPRVTIFQSQATSAQAKVTARGQAKSKFEATVVSEVTARVVGVESALASGRFVKKGALLATLDDTDYKRALASAETALANARVSLLMEKNKVLQAKIEWKRANLAKEPKSPLLLRQPQLKAAKADLGSAQAALAWAKKQLSNTRIRAPFNAVVVSRKVSPGSYLQPGQAVATLYSSDSVEIRVSLSPRQWALLPEESRLTSGDWSVVLTTEDSRSWSGVVGRVEHHADAATRQRAIVVIVENNPGKHEFLAPGTFVEATIPGKDLDLVMVLPESSLTSKGYVWFVTPDNTLARYQTDPLYRFENEIYIHPPEKKNTLNILKVPMSSYLPGMRVEMQRGKRS